ncbi:MAG TPA: A/G-specific adenine glycosylase [Terriglobia bacterium]
MLPPLVSWFKENQRPLPWRATYDPYHVWVSEVMLQQTQVETALPYYERFIREFPTVELLARADEQRVLTLWAGLGYYRRAKNFMAAAKNVVENHGGKIPADYDALLALPGIGQYMAGAILSIAFNKPYPVVDGNVRRVLSRVFGWTEENPKALWEAATRLVQEAEPRLVNQAVMELGAKVCSFKSPRCLICPLQSSCAAFRTGMQDKIPAVKKRPATVHVHLSAVICKKDDRYLMRNVNGMWEFPMLNELPEGSFENVGECKHTITHHRLDVSVYSGKIEQSGFEWTDIDAVPMSSLTRKILISHKKHKSTS